jgi:pimeloyl-ACP methyl ester carboxylesterase
MARFSSGGFELAYDDLAPAGASGRPCVLVHGFASNRDENWRRTGWYAAFERRRRRCAALDLRGHGESAKPHDAAAYAHDAMAGDVLALIDHLGFDEVDLVGYSMGARTVLAAALAAPERIANLVLGGVGERSLQPRGDAGGLVAAMLAEDPKSIDDPLFRGFRLFADFQGEDRDALAACASARGAGPDLEAMARLAMPVLVVAGERDELAGDPALLADAFAAGRAVALPGLDHFSAIPHATTKAAVFDFLDGLMDDPFAGSSF